MINWTTKDWLLAAGIGGVGLLLGAVLFRRKRVALSDLGEDTPVVAPPVVVPELAPPAAPPPRKKIPLENHCDCEIITLKSKGGSIRYAAKCPTSKIPRYVRKEFAEKMRGKKFCTDLLKPFTSLSGRWAADIRWGPIHRRQAAARFGV